MRPGTRTFLWVIVAGVLAPFSLGLMWASTKAPGMEPMGWMSGYFWFAACLGGLVAVLPAIILSVVAWRFRRGVSGRAPMIAVPALCLLCVCWSAAYLITGLSHPHMSVMEEAKPAWLGAVVFAVWGHPLAGFVIVASLLAAYAALWTTRVALPGECAKCGYDRRGLTGTVRCPECGALPGPASK